MVDSTGPWTDRLVGSRDGPEGTVVLTRDGTTRRILELVDALERRGPSSRRDHHAGRHGWWEAFTAVHDPSFSPSPGQPTTVTTVDEVLELAGWITAPDRERPVVVLTVHNGDRDSYFPPGGVQRLVGRDGDVVVIAQSAKGGLTRELARALPDGMMVFNGAARIYWPFSLAGEDPYRHPLIRADSDRTPTAEKRARLSNRWRQGPGETAPHTPGHDTSAPTASRHAPAVGAGEDELRVEITRAWLELLPDPEHRDRFGLRAYRLDPELVELLEVLGPARAPVVAAAARILSGHVWTQATPVPERVEEAGIPVLREEDLAVSWRYPLAGSDHVLFYWQPATGPITLRRIGPVVASAAVVPGVAPAPPRPRRPSASLLVSDEDLTRALRAAGRPLYVAELRAELEVPDDVPRERMSKTLNNAIERGLIIRTGQRRGARYSLA